MKRILKVAWEENEYDTVDFNDERLEKRAVNLLKRFSAEPESPINQVCLNWAETKAAYRFFKNQKITTSSLLAPHIAKTDERAKQYKKILAIQDTTFFNYTTHRSTGGLGNIGRRGSDPNSPKGLIMHTVFAVTLEGLPLGILNQRIYLRTLRKRASKEGSKLRFSAKDKESYKWVEGLINSNYHLEYSECTPITVCDREGDFYDMFELAHILKSSVIIRAQHDRMVLMEQRPGLQTYQKSEKRLWKTMKSQRCRGVLCVEIPSRGGELGSNPRIAQLELRYSKIKILPPQGHVNKAILNKAILYVIYVTERNTPSGETPLEWMLITNITIRTFEDAAEKVKWYSFRFRIETLHRILKSGFLVENCRLGTAESLTRYLTLMSVAAWRIFWITMIGRVSPNTPCTSFLSDSEWKVLYAKVYQTHNFPAHPISTHKAIHLIGRLGGFLDRKSDGEPGVTSLWRGWRRLNDLADGWDISTAA